MNMKACKSALPPTAVFLRVTLLRAYIRLHVVAPFTVLLVHLLAGQGPFPLLCFLSMAGLSVVFLILFLLLDHLYEHGCLTLAQYCYVADDIVTKLWTFCSCPVNTFFLGTLPKEMRTVSIVISTMLQGLLVHQTLAIVPRLWTAAAYTVGASLVSLLLSVERENITSRIIMRLAVCALYFATFILVQHLPRRPSAECEVQTDPSAAVNSVTDQFFDSMPYPVFLVDVDINTPMNSPPLMNQRARGLLAAHKFADTAALFGAMTFERSSCSLAEELSRIRKKVEQQYVAFECVMLNTSYSRKGFDASVFSFELPKEDSAEIASARKPLQDPEKGYRFAAIVLIPKAKDPVEEKRIMENFKDSLICSLSHELCTPINTIMNLLRMMTAGPREDSRELCEIAASNTELLNSKLQDLIDYTQIELHSFRPAEHNFCVNELFVDLMKIFKYETEHKGNKLEFEVNSKGKLWIMADRGRIRQVLIKLLTNANKYTSKGAITVSAKESQQNFDVVFKVADTGSGRVWPSPARSARR